MKSYLTAVYLSFFAVIAPIRPMVLLACAMIVTDTIFGIWKAYRLKQPISSRKMSNAISKTFLYCGAIVLLFFLEKNVLADVIGYFISIPLLLTKMFTFFCVSTEFKSISENYEAVTGVDLWSKFMNFIKRSKEDLQDLKK
jgi:hypothetical protein